MGLDHHVHEVSEEEGQGESPYFFFLVVLIVRGWKDF